MPFEPTETLGIVTVGNVLVLRWPRAATAEDVRSAQRALSAIATRHHKVALLSVLADGPLGGTPSEGVREESRKLMSMPGVPLVGSAVVFAGQGFAGAVLRGILSSFALVAGSGAPMRVFGNAEDAARWVVAALGDDAASTAGELARAAR